MIERDLGRPFRRRSNPRGDVQRIRDAMLNFLETYPSSGTRARGFPPVNVTQDHDSYYIRAKVPGVKSRELDVSTAERTITLAGKRAAPDAGLDWHRRERPHGEFYRILTLPADFEGEQAQANLSAGILTVTLPKTEAAKARRIIARGR